SGSCYKKNKRTRIQGLRTTLGSSDSLMNQLRIAVVCDFLEENWPSMDLVADMLVTYLQRDHSDLVAVTRIRPPMRRRFTSRQQATGKRFNADRFVNRFWDYPQLEMQIRKGFDMLHIVDHSYGQL